MTLADELESVWAEARGELQEAFFTDTYALQRPSKADDGRGGRTSTLTTIETGRCMLQVRETSSGGEQVATDIALTISSYTALLPIDSVITTNDPLLINGRSFNVRDVKRGGDWGLFARVELEEKDR